MMTDMKKLIVFLTIVMTALNIEAAPPLRALKAPMDVCFCASEAVIGSGGYLPHTGHVRVLTILAAFEDVGFTVNDPVQAFDQYLNGDKQVDMGNRNDLNVASVRQYFETCSHGQFSPQFKVVGPVTLPQTMDYYGGVKDDGSDDKFGEFCQDALALAKDMVDDWSVYDNDNDSRVELVCVIYAGYGQNQGGENSTLWAKASTQNLLADDTHRITRFNCSPELFNPDERYSNYINGTGVFIHELSHCMGLPDLYATQKKAYVNNQGMETWSIMDYGLYNRNGFAPCPYTAWEQEVMGWTEIEDVGSKMADGRCQLSDVLPLIEGGKAYKLQNPDNDRNYIVLENVQKRGLNQYASGHGLLVFQVDYPYSSVNMSDTPNNNPGHPSVAVVPAGGELINAYLRGKDKTYTVAQWQESLAASVFPGTKGVTSLTDNMQLPNYCFYVDKTAQPTNFMLSSISEDTETGAVSFLVAKDDQTSIGDVRWKMEDGRSDVWYDLSGRAFNTQHSSFNIQKGIYIVNGRKVVIK